MTDLPASRPTIEWRVPFWGVVLLVFSLIGQAAGGLTWAAKASERLDQVESRQDQLKDVPAVLGRLDERTAQMAKQLDHLESRP